MDTPLNHATPSAPQEVPKKLFDANLAAYDLLRRLICRRPPFDDEVGVAEAEKSLIPEEFKGKLQLGVRGYQAAMHFAAVKARLGTKVSEDVKRHVLSLSDSDPVLKASFPILFEAIRTADAGYADGLFVKAFPEVSQEAYRYYASLGTTFLIAGGCPEECQAPLAGTVGVWLCGAPQIDGNRFAIRRGIGRPCIGVSPYPSSLISSLWTRKSSGRQAGRSIPSATPGV